MNNRIGRGLAAWTLGCGLALAGGCALESVEEGEIALETEALPPPIDITPRYCTRWVQRLGGPVQQIGYVYNGGCCYGCVDGNGACVDYDQEWYEACGHPSIPPAQPVPPAPLCVTCQPGEVCISQTCTGGVFTCYSMLASQGKLHGACVGDLDCAASDYCMRDCCTPVTHVCTLVEQCVPKKDSGQPCVESHECVSGTCVPGFPGSCL
jgi:hypothetical protein